MTKVVNTIRINVPTRSELEDYLKDIMQDFADEEGEFTDDSIIEIREVLLDYLMDNLEVEVV